MAETTKRTESKKSTFEVLNAVNVNEKKEKKNKLDYLSWAWAWTEVKKRYPTATFEYLKNEDGWNYHTDGRTAWVEVAVEIDGLRYEEHLPIMDYNNKSIPIDRVTSFDVNKAQKRCLAKCIALHGLGLYIYAGEDLPEEVSISDGEGQEPPKEREKTACTKCGKEIKNSGQYTAQAIIEESTKKLGKPVCLDCWKKLAEAARKAKEAENAESV